MTFDIKLDCHTNIKKYSTLNFTERGFMHTQEAVIKFLTENKYGNTSREIFDGISENKWIQSGLKNPIKSVQNVISAMKRRGRITCDSSKRFTLVTDFMPPPKKPRKRKRNEHTLDLSQPHIDEYIQKKKRKKIESDAKYLSLFTMKSKGRAELNLPVIRDLGIYYTMSQLKGISAELGTSFLQHRASNERKIIGAVRKFNMGQFHTFVNIVKHCIKNEPNAYTQEDLSEIFLSTCEAYCDPLLTNISISRSPMGYRNTECRPAFDKLMNTLFDVEYYGSIVTVFLERFPLFRDGVYQSYIPRLIQYIYKFKNVSASVYARAYLIQLFPMDSGTSESSWIQAMMKHFYITTMIIDKCIRANRINHSALSRLHRQLYFFKLSFNKTFDQLENTVPMKRMISTMATMLKSHYSEDNMVDEFICLVCEINKVWDV
jgi:hypothetical protein